MGFEGKPPITTIGVDIETPFGKGVPGVDLWRMGHFT